MKYYYKLFVHEGLEDSLKSLNAPESFIELMKKSATYNAQIEDNMKEFYVGYDIEKIRKGKPNDAWTWCSVKSYYRVNWTYKGEVHPHRKNAINKLKELWKDND